MTTAPHDPEIPLVFGLLADLAIAKGAAPLNKHVGCWEYQIDGTWWVAINGHASPSPCTKGQAVPPFHAYVEYNGWPGGYISPGGGVLCAGAAANEDTLAEALQKALRKVQPKG